MPQSFYPLSDRYRQRIKDSTHSKSAHDTPLWSVCKVKPDGPITDPFLQMKLQWVHIWSHDLKECDFGGASLTDSSQTHRWLFYRLPVFRLLVFYNPTQMNSIRREQKKGLPTQGWLCGAKWPHTLPREEVILAEPALWWLISLASHLASKWIAEAWRRASSWESENILSAGPFGVRHSSPL